MSTFMLSEPFQTFLGSNLTTHPLLVETPTI